MGQPLISICVPTYNGESYLRQCLESCVNQDFRDFEVIICDDGSTDNSVAINTEFSQKYPFIRLFHNEKNLGLVGNWNKCMELASGQWIKFLFQDDVMLPNALQCFYENMDAGINLLVCKRNFELPSDATEAQKRYYSEEVRTLENTGRYNSAKFTPESLSTIAAQNISLNFIAEPSLTLFKKEVVKEVGQFDDELKQICDLEFFLRVGSIYGLKYIPEKLCMFRIHAGSTTEKNIKGGNYRLDYLEALLFALKLLTKNQFSHLRFNLSWFSLLKVRLYVRYKSYVAFSNIRSDSDHDLYRVLEQQYGNLLFKKHEVFFFSLLYRLKTPDN